MRELGLEDSVKWTEHQDEMWKLCRGPGRPPVPSGDQQYVHAFNFAITGFQQACYFDGVEPPSREAIAARFIAEYPDSSAVRAHLAEQREEARDGS